MPSRFVFAIPLKPRAVAQDWDLIVNNLSHTLRSILNSANGAFTVAVASHDELPAAMVADDRISVLRAPFKHEPDPQKGERDKYAKIRFIGSWLREQGLDDFYLMFLDADDLIHKDLVGTVLETDNRLGFLLRDGYRLDTTSGDLALQPENFFHSCGSCYVGYFRHSELPQSLGDTEAYYSQFVKHRERGELATEHGRPPETLPYPGVVYVTNHSESVMWNKLDGTVRKLQKRMIIGREEAASLLRGNFAYPRP